MHTHLHRSPLTILLLALGLALTTSASAGPAEEPAEEPLGPYTPPHPGTEVHIDFVDADPVEVIQYFAELTGRNFVLAERLKGRITIISPRPVPLEAAWEAFLSTLDAAGYTIVEQGEVVHVVPQRDAIRQPIPTAEAGEAPHSAHMITHLIHLQRAETDDLARIAARMVGDGGSVTAFTPANCLIVTDSANNIRRIAELLAELDVSDPAMELAIIPIEFAGAAQVVEQITAMFEVGERSKPAEPRKRTRRTSRRSRRNKRSQPTATTTTGEAVGTSVTIAQVLADERTNAVIIRATDDALADVRAFIAQVDIDVDPHAEGTLHVVYLENADAEEMAQVLDNLVQETRAKQQTGRRTSRRSRRSRATTAPPSEQSVGSLEGKVEITADPAINGLVIIAEEQDYRRVRRVIEMLDIRRKQVFLEAVVMEISDSAERDTGVGFHSGHDKEEIGESGLGLGAVGSVGGGSLMSALSTDGSGLAADLSGAALGVFGSSLEIPYPGSETGTLEIPAFGIVLTAIESDTNIEVLSAPNVMAMDNEEAEIVVGQTIPFSAGFTTTTQGTPIANFSREDVALTLRITPQINEGDTVTLEVFLEITEVVPESQGTDLLSSGGVTTTKRSAESMISVHDNQTVVLGGLMQTNQTEDESKVPVLGDIPLLGGLFRSRKATNNRTNLLVFLTPHVIDGPEDLQQIYEIKMLQRQEFMRMFHGKSLEERQQALERLLLYSMGLPGVESVWQADAPEVDAPPATGP